MSLTLAGLNVLAVAMTFVGGVIPLMEKLMSRQGLWRLFSLRSGILLAITFTQIFPEAWHHHQTAAGWGAVSAFVLFFWLESYAILDSCPEYLEECPVHLLGWGAMAALSLHSFIDGFNLSVSFAAGELAGLSVGVALALHKIADGFTLHSLFQEAGYSKNKAMAALAAVALATPLGSFLSAAGLAALPPEAVGGLLGFAAGSFLYIGAADILPRIHRTHDRMTPLFFAAALLSVGFLSHLTGGSGHGH